MSKVPFTTKEKLEEIAKVYPTPFHLYDEAGIRKNAKAVQDAFAWNPGFREYFAVKAKALLDKGVTIEQVNGVKTLFTISPADGSYKVNFGEEEFENYFKAFLRPQLVDMLF